MALVFLPWIRFGVGALNTTHSKQEIDKDGNVTVRQTARRNVEIDANVRDKEGSLLGGIKKSFTLKGPGEVLGFSEQVISLKEPVTNEKAFPPNQMTYVDFIDADFPWRYSLEEPDAQNRLKPWLLLVVLKKGEYTELPPVKSAALISVNSGLLPDPNDAWAFAHVQISTLSDFSPADMNGFVKKHPECVHARLLCTRRLQATQSYTAFLVPVYKMGVNAALELDVGDSAEFAWNPAAPAVLALPYYYRWDFYTSETGDFEELAGRIKVFDDLSVISGSRTVKDSQGNEMEFEGIVLPESKAPSNKVYNVDFSRNSVIQFNRMYGKQPNQAAASNSEPELFIPLYGQNHADCSRLIESKASGTWENALGSYDPRYDPARSTDLWFSEANLDRNYRYAASLGASVVRYNQDDFISRCFAMSGDIKEVNQLIKRYKALKSIRKSLVRRHLNTMDNVRFMHVTKNLQKYYVESEPAGNPVFTTNGADISKAFRTERSSYRNISMNLMKSMNICKSLGEQHVERLMNFGSDTEKNAFMNDAQLFKSILLNTDTEKEILNRIVASPDGSEVGDGEIYLEPRIDEGLLKFVPAKTLQSLAPGISELPNNSSMLLAMNREFMEAFMLGANHEMVRELIWREFPIGRRATVFNSFWGAEGANRTDIKDISEWSGRLGFNSGGSNAGQDNIIVALKADLFRRYPQTLLFAVEYDPAVVAGSGFSVVINAVKQGASQPGAKLYKPLFSVDVMEDLIFVYYDFTKQYMDTRKFYFVMLENVTIPKFGLDESVTAVKDGLDDLAWGDFDVNPVSGYLNIATLGGKLSSMNFGSTQVNKTFNDSAKLALITLNRPSGVIMDFSQLTGTH